MERALVVIEVDDGLKEAHPVAARDAQLDARLVALGQQLLQLLVHGTGACGKPAAALSYHKPHAAPPSAASAASWRRTFLALSGVRLL